MRKTLPPLLGGMLAALAAASPAAAQSSHGSMDHSTMQHGAAAAASETVTAEATVNAIAGDTVNVTHGPIAEIGWPAMTMDLSILEGADLGGVSAGDAATMTLEKGPDGLWAVRALMPRP